MLGCRDFYNKGGVDGRVGRVDRDLADAMVHEVIGTRGVRFDSLGEIIPQLADL